MQRIFQVIIVFSIFFSGAIAANARSATNEELKMLNDATNNYANALQTANFDAVLNAIPPRIIQKLAAQSKVDQEQFRQIMVNQMKQLAETYKVDTITIGQSKKRAGEFDDGTPYYIIPTDFVITTNETEKNQINGELVAILDNNQWYFVRGDDATTLSTMSAAFPGFEKIKLSAPEVKKLETAAK